MRIWRHQLVLVVALASLGAADSLVQRRQSHPPREWKLGKTVEESKFIFLTHAGSSACSASTPPQPLTTPQPLIDPNEVQHGLSVSFVVGTDGLVHSALLLRSLGDREDRAVLEAVRSWRYRPAMCNGVPAEVEATVEFSRRQRNSGLE